MYTYIKLNLTKVKLSRNDGPRLKNSISRFSSKFKIVIGHGAILARLFNLDGISLMAATPQMIL
jgi:hypothetical protein